MLFHARVIIRHQFFELQADKFSEIRDFIGTIPVEFGCRMSASSNLDGRFISNDEVVGMFHISENDEYKQYLIARHLALKEPSFDSIQKLLKG